MVEHIPSIPMYSIQEYIPHTVFLPSGPPLTKYIVHSKASCLLFLKTPENSGRCLQQTNIFLLTLLGRSAGVEESGS